MSEILAAIRKWLTIACGKGWTVIDAMESDPTKPAALPYATIMMSVARPLGTKGSVQTDESAPVRKYDRIVSQRWEGTLQIDLVGTGAEDLAYALHLWLEREDIDVALTQAGVSIPELTDVTDATELVDGAVWLPHFQCDFRVSFATSITIPGNVIETYALTATLDGTEVSVP